MRNTMGSSRSGRMPGGGMRGGAGSPGAGMSGALKVWAKVNLASNL
jgi:hypothetical protein